MFDIHGYLCSSGTTQGDCADIKTLAACPMGTVFMHEYLEWDDESERCILISAGDVASGDMFRVRYIDLEGNTHTMWVNDDDSAFFVVSKRPQPMTIEDIDMMLSIKTCLIK